MSTLDHDTWLAALKTRSRLLVESLELSVILDEESLMLRIELFESLTAPGHFSARLWRLEMYRLQSTFPQLTEGIPRHEPSDELILKEFESFESPLEEPVAFPDRIAAREYVLERLAQWLADVGAELES